nr:hypothetical protein [Bacillus pumilus]
MFLIVLSIAYFSGFMTIDWVKLSDFALASLGLLGSWVLAKFHDSGSTP